MANKTVAVISNGVWQANTAYSLGQTVSNDTNKIYKCITAGTSAASGGPTGTNSDITDNGAHWAYQETVDGSYTSLNAALSGESTNLVTNTRILTIKTYSFTDTTAAVYGAAWTSSTSYYVKIIAANGSGAGIKWYSDRYILKPSTDVAPLTPHMNCPYTRIENIQIETPSSSYTSALVALGEGEGNRLEKCFLKGVDGEYTFGISNTGTADIYVINTIFYNCARTWAGGIRNYNTGKTYVYNCIFYSQTAVAYGNAIRGASIVSRNNAVFGYQTSYAFNEVTDNQYCCTDGATPPGSNNQVSKTAANQFNSLVSGSENFHIAKASDCYNNGVDLSGTFTDDIKGSTRSIWSIGAAQTDDKTVTVNPAGGATYTSLNAAYSGEDGVEFDAYSGVLFINCLGANVDSTAADQGTGFSNPSATHYVCTTGNNTTGKYSSNYYRITHTVSYPLITRTAYSVVDKIQVYTAAYDYQSGIYGLGGNSTIKNCIVRMPGTPTYRGFGIGLPGVGGKIINCTVYGVEANGASCANGVYVSSGTVEVYNTTVYNVQYGIYHSYQNIKAINCLVFGCSTNSFYPTGSSSWITGSGYNASDRIEGPGTGFTNLTGLSASEIFANPVNEDFHLITGSAGVANGYNLSTIFTTDIDGETIVGDWCVGSDWRPELIYPLIESFENPAGFDLGSLWSWTSATTDPDYLTNIPAAFGTECLRFTPTEIVNGNAWLYKTYTENEYFVRIEFFINSLPDTGNFVGFGFSGDEDFYFELDMKVDTDEKIKPYLYLYDIDYNQIYEGFQTYEFNTETLYSIEVRLSKSDGWEIRINGETFLNGEDVLWATTLKYFDIWASGANVDALVDNVRVGIDDWAGPTFEIVGNATVVLKYKTGATSALCEAADYIEYTEPFDSEGFVKLRVEG